jgi:hypothetical protein
VPIQLQGAASGVGVDSDSNRNLLHRRGNAHYGATGGAFAVAGGPTAIVAAALAANTPLMALRHGAAATSNLFITRLKFSINPATVGASAGVPGQIAWQKFTTATPSGGTARTPGRKDNVTGSATQVADVRDSNAALTVTSVVFTDIFVIHPIPNYTTGGSNEYVTDLDEDEWIRLAAGEGIALRTQVAAPATMTWTYTYGIHYLEK